MIQSVKFTIWEISRIWKKRGDKAEYDLFVFLLYRQKVWRHFIKVEWEIKTVI